MRTLWKAGAVGKIVDGVKLLGKVRVCVLCGGVNARKNCPLPSAHPPAKPRPTTGRKHVFHPCHHRGVAGLKVCVRVPLIRASSAPALRLILPPPPLPSPSLQIILRQVGHRGYRAGGRQDRMQVLQQAWSARASQGEDRVDFAHALLIPTDTIKHHSRRSSPTARRGCHCRGTDCTSGMQTPTTAGLWCKIMGWDERFVRRAISPPALPQLPRDPRGTEQRGRVQGVIQWCKL